MTYLGTSDRVENLIHENDAVRRVHDSLEDDLARTQFAEFLHRVLDNRDELGLDARSVPDEAPSEDACTTVWSLAKDYVDHPLWHTPWLTRYLLVGVVESQLNLLLWASKWGRFPHWSLRHSLSSPYRTFVPPLVSLAIFLGSAILLGWLLTKDHFFMAALLGVWMLYFYLIEKPLTWWRRRKHRTHFARLAQLLVIPLYEIKSSNYDPETIARRLQACEQKDLQVASIAFALLKLHPHAHQSCAGMSVT